MFFFEKKVESISLEELAQLTGGSLPSEVSSENFVIHEVASLANAKPGDLTFYSNPSYLSLLSSTKASFCLIKKENFRLLNPGVTPIFHSLPQEAFARVLAHFYGKEEIAPSNKSFISPSATIKEGAKIGKNVQIYENAVVSEDAEICDNVIIHPGVYIGKKVKIDENTIIHDNISLMFCRIGKNTIIRSGSRIGTSGFGFTPNTKTGVHTYIPQIAGVLIGDNVDIGANVTIDRGCIEPTIIEDNVKIDNLVQIGHGVKIGASTFIAGQCGIAGSAEIGKMVFMGGQSGVAGHIKVPDFTRCFARTGFHFSLKEKGLTVAGAPVLSYRKWLRLQALLNKMTDKDK